VLAVLRATLAVSVYGCSMDDDSSAARESCPLETGRCHEQEALAD
jgi:hypothetical protein